MTINQLFIRKPEKIIIEKFLLLFGYNLDNIDENIKFNKNKLLSNNILDKFESIEDELKENYINCKQKIYFDNITIKKILTILRHHLRLINYKLVSEIKYYNNQKIINYKIINLKKDSLDSKNCIITFD